MQFLFFFHFFCWEIPAGTTAFFFWVLLGQCQIVSQEKIGEENEWYFLFSFLGRNTVVYLFFLFSSTMCVCVDLLFIIYTHTQFLTKNSDSRENIWVFCSWSWAQVYSICKFCSIKKYSENLKFLFCPIFYIKKNQVFFLTFYFSRNL